MAIDLNDLATAIGQLILRFIMRNDTAANWTAKNPVLMRGEEGYEYDTKKRKVGDGTTAWTSLTYSTGVASVVAGTNVTVDSTDPANPIVSATGGGGGGGNTTPDSHPASPTAWDDEFEYGTAVDTTGARRSGANAWSLYLYAATPAPTVSQGSLQFSYGSGLLATMLQTAPTGDFTIMLKQRRYIRSANVAFQLMIWNSANNNYIAWYPYSPSPVVAVTKGQWDTTTKNTSSSVNLIVPGSTTPSVDQDVALYFRIRVVSGTINFEVSLSGYDNQWINVYSQTVATYIGAITHVGMMLGSVSSVAACDFFRRTA